MLIIGAKGFAKEILESVIDKNIVQIAFFDDINFYESRFLYGKYPILNSIKEVCDFFEKEGCNFTIGIGSPKKRQLLYNKFTEIGGNFTSSIDDRAHIGTHDVEIGDGCNILAGVNISNSVKIGKGCIIYYQVNITHDCKISDFVEISPSANILGRVRVGKYAHIGANSTILPDIQIGKNVVIGAGAVVTKNLPDNVVAVGVPAKIIKELKSD